MWCSLGNKKSIVLKVVTHNEERVILCNTSGCLRQIGMSIVVQNFYCFVQCVTYHDYTPTQSYAAVL